MKHLHDIGLRGRLLNFISNFLSDRSFNVRIGSTLSDTFKQEHGVSQEILLSPILLNIKINNFIKCVCHLINVFVKFAKINFVNDTDSLLYVDGIFYKSKNMKNIEFRLQRCLNKVETWTTESLFKFSNPKPSVQLKGLYPDLIFMDRLFPLLKQLNLWVFRLIRSSLLFLT